MWAHVSLWQFRMHADPVPEPGIDFLWYFCLWILFDIFDLFNLIYLVLFGFQMEYSFSYLARLCPIFVFYPQLKSFFLDSLIIMSERTHCVKNQEPGFPKLGLPNNGYGKIPSMNGWFRGTPILGNPHIPVKKECPMTGESLPHEPKAPTVDWVPWLSFWLGLWRANMCDITAM